MEGRGPLESVAVGSGGGEEQAAGPQEELQARQPEAEHPCFGRWCRTNCSMCRGGWRTHIRNGE